MDDARQPDVSPPEEPGHVGPPDLILQAIVPPADAPAEIRAAVADALARLDVRDGRKYGWEDVSFAASAIALVEGTNRRADPDSQWVFALTADSPKLGEQVQPAGRWSSTVIRDAHSSGGGRVLWRASVLDHVSTAPRPGQPQPPGRS